MERRCPVATPRDARAPKRLSKAEFEELAAFRAALRRYLRFSEELVRAKGLTPQQYQLLLAVKGYPGRDWATVGELAEQLQLRHHSVVELVDRAQRSDLVCRVPDPRDARVVRVQLTTKGDACLGTLSALHKQQLLQLEPGALNIPFADQR
jgi:DNA-binding MarR family transcriptional regulator